MSYFEYAGYFFLNVPMKILVPWFTNAISCFEHSKNKGTTGVLWRCKVPLGAILVPLGYYSKKSKPENP
jgi:hypothetical protein